MSDPFNVPRSVPNKRASESEERSADGPEKPQKRTRTTPSNPTTSSRSILPAGKSEKGLEPSKVSRSTSSTRLSSSQSTLSAGRLGNGLGTSRSSFQATQFGDINNKHLDEGEVRPTASRTLVNGLDGGSKLNQAATENLDAGHADVSHEKEDELVAPKGDGVSEATINAHLKALAQLSLHEDVAQEKEAEVVAQTGDLVSKEHLGAGNEPVTHEEETEPAAQNGDVVSTENRAADLQAETQEPLSLALELMRAELGSKDRFLATLRPFEHLRDIPGDIEERGKRILFASLCVLVNEFTTEWDIIHEMRQELSALVEESSHEGLDTVIQGLHQQIEDREGQLNNLREVIADQGVELADVDRTKAAFEASNEQCESLNEDLAEARASIQRKVNAYQNMRENFDAAKTAKEEVQVALDEARKRIETLEQDPEVKMLRACLFLKETADGEAHQGCPSDVECVICKRIDALWSKSVAEFTTNEENLKGQHANELKKVSKEIAIQYERKIKKREEELKTQVRDLEDRHAKIVAENEVKIAEYEEQLRKTQERLTTLLGNLKGQYLDGLKNPRKETVAELADQHANVPRKLREETVREYEEKDSNDGDDGDDKPNSTLALCKRQIVSKDAELAELHTRLDALTISAAQHSYREQTLLTQIEDERKNTEDRRKQLEDERKKIEDERKTIEDERKQIQDERKQIQDQNTQIEEERKEHAGKIAALTKHYNATNPIVQEKAQLRATLAQKKAVYESAVKAREDVARQIREEREKREKIEAEIEELQKDVKPEGKKGRQRAGKRVDIRSL